MGSAMNKTDDINNILPVYYSIFITGLLISNVLGSKIVTIYGLRMPSATIAYAVTYLMTDVVGELYGKKAADRLVKIGLALILPSDNDTSAFNQIFNSTTRIIIASLSGYLISQSVDVFIFHKIKSYSEKYKFLRNNISTIISQFIDTAVFSFIAFYGIVPRVADLLYGVFFAKVILALCDTPFFYLLTRRSKQRYQCFCQNLGRNKMVNMDLSIKNADDK